MIDITLSTSEETIVDSFFLTVREVNDVPIALDEIFSSDEDLVLTVTVDANDGDPTESTFDQQDLTFTALTSFTNGTYELGLNDGLLVYNPSTNFYGLDTMIYQVMDSGTTLGESDPKMDSATLSLIHISEPTRPY